MNFKKKLKLTKFCVNDRISYDRKIQAKASNEIDYHTARAKAKICQRLITVNSAENLTIRNYQN